MSLSPPPTVPFNVVGFGVSGIVCWLQLGRVIKIANQTLRLVAHERTVYERLGSHPFILKCFGQYRNDPQSAVLEYHPRGTLRQVLEGNDKNTDLPRLKWAIQIARAVCYLHTRGVVHFDLNASNVLLTKSGDIALFDFAFSSLDGTKLRLTGHEAHDVRNHRPQCQLDESGYAGQVDLFAMGSLLYELFTHSKPYADKEGGEV